MQGQPTSKTLCTTLCLAALWIQPSHAGTLERLESTVAFLKAEVPVTETVNGDQWEVWLKPPKIQAFRRKTLEVTGSGFFVGTDRLVYLVTAKHVATNMDKNSEVTVRGTDGRPLTLRLAELRGTNNPHITWVHHPDLDLSVHPMIPENPRILDIMQGHAIPLSMLKTNTRAPSRDVVLSTLGFPLGIGVDTEFSPFSKDSRVGSALLQEGNYGYFLLQDPSISGFSGAPVIESGDTRLGTSSGPVLELVGRGAACWGVVSATLGDVSGGKMAKVIPSRYVAQMISQFEASLTFIPIGTTNAPPSEAPAK